MAAQKVLLIEDNAVNCEVIRQVLEADGFEVAPAATAGLGIEMALRQQPEIILMDVSLPGMNGLDAIAALRRHPETQAACIIVLSAHASVADAKCAKERGAHAYLAKPINTRTFALDLRRIFASFINLLSIEPAGA